MSGRSGSVAIEIAQKLDDSLKAILPDGSVAKKEDYYRMLCTVTAIQKQADRYTKQAEESGDTEPALALLLAYLKNYGGITDTFNHRLASLPGIYLREILHAEPKAAEPDNAYAVITSKEEAARRVYQPDAVRGGGCSLSGQGTAVQTSFVARNGTAVRPWQSIIYRLANRVSYASAGGGGTESDGSLFIDQRQHFAR